MADRWHSGGSSGLTPTLGRLRVALPVMHILLIIVAVLAGIVGGLTLSNATAGVGVICGGCLAAILARIAQSAVQHEKLQALLKEQAAAAQLKPGGYQGEFGPGAAGLDMNKTIR